MRTSSTRVSLVDQHHKNNNSSSSQLSLVGRSRAGDGTSFVIPELKWMFDCGALVAQQGSAPTHIFLTHTHSDHVTFLTHVCSNDNNHKSTKHLQPTAIYLPAPALPFVERYFEAHHALVEMTDWNTETEETDTQTNKKKDKTRQACSYKLHPTTPNQEFKIRQRGGDEFRILPIEADHRIPCHGYSIFRRRKRLHPDYAHLPGAEIAKLRRQPQPPQDLFHYVQEPVLCYIGDSTHRVFERYPEVLQQHLVIVTECSFLATADVGRAEETKHTHWTNLKPIVEAHPQILFILIHFSLKHSALQVLDFFYHPETGAAITHRNVHPMLVQEEIENEWNKRLAKQQQTPTSGETLARPPTCQCFRCQPR